MDACPEKMSFFEVNESERKRERARARARERERGREGEREREREREAAPNVGICSLRDDVLAEGYIGILLWWSKDAHFVAFFQHNKALVRMCVVIDSHDQITSRDLQFKHCHPHDSVL